jgi:hypothetical protein
MATHTSILPHRGSSKALVGMDADAASPPPGSNVVAIEAVMATITVIHPCRGSSNTVLAMEAVMATQTSILPPRGRSKALV